MFESLIETIDGAYQPQRIRDLLVRLWQQEVWFDTPHQRATAEMARDLLAEAGLSGVRLAGYPCDGRTRYQDWIMHMAWDCPSARLAFAVGQRVGWGRGAARVDRADAEEVVRPAGQERGVGAEGR